jgi:lipoprotein Spr
MKLVAGLFFLLLSFSLFAQAKKGKALPDFCHYYENVCLNPDSAQDPHLFYQVYVWAGTRYKYSGKNKKGIDCSGFVREVYKETYCIELSGGSRDIWPKVQPLEREELKEGDMVFFKIKKGQISHVGVYLGNNKFAHASVKAGVIISDLDEAYYRKYFFKGGRLKASAGTI